MDYLSKVLQDDMVDSPPNCIAILVALNSSSPLQSTATPKFSKLKCQNNNGAQCNLYLVDLSLSNCRLYVV